MCVCVCVCVCARERIGGQDGQMKCICISCSAHALSLPKTSYWFVVSHTIIVQCIIIVRAAEDKKKLPTIPVDTVNLCLVCRKEDSRETQELRTLESGTL